MRTQFNNRQAALNEKLHVIDREPDTQNKDVLSAFDQNFDAPLRLLQTDPLSSKLLIRPSEVPLADGTGRSTPPADAQIPDYPLTEIYFQDQSIVGGDVQIEWPSSTVGWFRRVGFTLLPDGTLRAVFTPEVELMQDLANPGTVFIDGIPAGWVDLECTDVSGRFKTAGSAADVIENAVGGNARIHVFGSGGGAGSGDGDANDFLIQASRRFDASLFENRHINLFSRDTDELIDSASTGNYDLITKTFIFTDTGDTLISQGVPTDDSRNVSVFARFSEGMVDEDALFEISPDGGSSWLPVQMRRLPHTDDYVGFKVVPQASEFILRITSSQGDVALEGYALFHEERLANPEEAIPFSKTGFQAAMAENFVTEPGFSQSVIDSDLTTAKYNQDLRLFRAQCSKGIHVSTTGMSFTLGAAPGFEMKPGDIIWSDDQEEWRRVTSLTSQTEGELSSAFSSDNNGDGMVSQAVWTKDIINFGDPNGIEAPLPFSSLFGSVDQKLINLSYQDSLQEEDRFSDLTESAKVVASASNLSVNGPFAPVFRRPVFGDLLEDYALVGEDENLILTFFCDPENTNVTEGANLIGFDLSLYPEDVLLNGGYLDSAFAVTDGSGTPVNSEQPYEEGGKTRWKIFNYVPGLNPGKTAGDVEIILDGKVIPRFISGADQDAWFEEVSHNEVDLWVDLTSMNLSLEAKRRQGSIDTSDQNTLRLATFQEAIVGDVSQVEASIATHSSLQQAIDDTEAGGKIRVLTGTFSENIVLNKRLFIEGFGFDSFIDGNLTVESEYSTLKFLRFNEVTLNAASGGNILTHSFVSDQPTDNGQGNVIDDLVEVD